MNNKKSFSNKAGVHVPSLLLPKDNIDLAKWSVVACDQYTSELEYWDQVEANVGEQPSTLRLIFPEVYLEKGSDDARIEVINRYMQEYLQSGILVEHKPGFIYIDRKTSGSASRKGLILAIDLEQYDYNKGARTLIRATEGTVIERLPPRIRIRENAPIELPHIMLLIDDPEQTVIEPLSESTNQFDRVYDFDLMMNGGHITGYRIENKEIIAAILSALEKLADPSSFRSKYCVDSDKGVLLFAAGDGNHSLATAKACWEKIKGSLNAEEKENHPARYALVEIVNVHDEGLKFEPIHRVVFNVDIKDLLNRMTDYFSSKTGAACYISYSEADTGIKAVELAKEGQSHVIPFITKEGRGKIIVVNPSYNLEVGTLQAFLDELIKTDSKIKIDYIHGEEVVDRLGSMEGNIGFYLPPMDKNDLFKTVILDGVLPRKTFSMGEAEEKRFYLECRRISTI